MPVYILTIPGSEFTGVMAGVDFFKGKGSTSSLADAHVLAQTKNCGVAVIELDGTERPVELIRTNREHLAPAFTVTPVAEPGPSQASKAEGVADPASSVILSPAAKALKDAEDNPDSEWSKKRAAGADRKKQKRQRRRRP